MKLDRGRKKGFSFVSILIVCMLLAATFAPVAAKPAANGPEGGPFPHTTIFSDISGEPTADVPGFPGIHFSSFDRIFGSPNGNWILTADTDAPTGADEVIVANGAVQIFEGDPAPWTGGAENVGFIETNLGINDAGEWTFATNTDGPTTADEYIVSVSAGGTYTTAAREGDPAPQVPGATWDEPLESALIASDGSIGWVGDGLDGIPTTEDEVVVLGPNLLAQEGVTVPTGQTGSEAWENFDLNDFSISADGTSYIVQGDLTGDTNFDDVAVVDGAVVVQEGVVLPGSGYPNPVDSSGIVGVWMAPNGDWFVRGNNDVSEHDWVYSNGFVIAERGAPIYAGATEVYSDTLFGDLFFLHVGDSFGNYVIGGVSDNPDPEADGVLVVNNQAVVARQGDPVDIDNDGVFDDDTYFDTFGNDDAFLDDNGVFYIVATIMDGTNTQIGQGVFSIDLSSILGNQPPTIMNVATVSPIDENDETRLTADVADPEDDPLSLVVDWGDGTVMTYTYPSGTTAITETHQYLDDDPTGTPSDTYNVSLILDDGGGMPATAVTAVTVNNVPPVVSATADNTIVTLGAPINFTGAFTDVGTLDTHTIDWDFGDGNTATGTLTPTHTYTATGVYVVNLTVVDDDTGAGGAAVTVTVSEPTDVSLSSFGEADGPGMMLWLLPLLALLAVVPVLIRRRMLAD